MRLRRSDTGGCGYGRRRRGSGFSFHDQQGRTIGDPDELARLRALVIPPAWREVWISPDPHGHIQAIGIDAAGRKQYLYHPQWRTTRDAAKFAHILEVAARLPRLRRRVAGDLAAPGFPRERVLSVITRLLDSGLFRVGGDEYAAGEEPTYGVATLRPEHVHFRRGYVTFEYLAKGGLERVQTVADPRVRAVLRQLVRRRAGQDRLFAYRNGRHWREVRSDDVNAYLREVSGGEMTAKDFRTWHATVLAAIELAATGPQGSETGCRKAIARAMREVAELLGNTPPVARASYVDPRVLDLYREGVVADVAHPAFPPTPSAERAVLRLLGRH
jgi:DNA topoisomerase IB